VANAIPLQILTMVIYAFSKFSILDQTDKVSKEKVPPVLEQGKMFEALFQFAYLAGVDVTGQ